MKKWIRKDFPIFQNWLIREKNEIVTFGTYPIRPAESISELGRTRQAASMDEIKGALNRVLEAWHSGDSTWLRKRYVVEHLVEAPQEETLL